MDRPDESRRHQVTAPVTRKGAAPERDPHAPEQVPTEPVLIELTEDEQLNGLEFFSAEQPQISEGVPAPDDSIHRADPTLGLIAKDVAPHVIDRGHATPPVQPDAWSSLTWQAPLVAAVLTAVVVIYGVMSVSLMRTTTDGRLATLNDRTAERAKAALAPRTPPVPKTAPVPRTAPAPRTAAVAAIPSSPTPRAAAEPTPVSSAKRRDDISASNKASKAVVSRESASLRAPARSTPPVAAPPISPGRQATPVRRDPPIQSASASSPRTAEPVPMPEPAAAPLVSSLTPPASLPVQPNPVVAVPAPAPLPRAEASAAPLPRMPAPETAIQTVLAQYRTAYGDLDAGAARAVWPSVDDKALRKAFERLEEQRLIFNYCDIAVSNVRAVASCDGSVRYVPRVGKKDPHDDRRQWEFKLSKVDEVWLIDTVSAR